MTGLARRLWAACNKEASWWVQLLVALFGGYLIWYGLHSPSLTVCGGILIGAYLPDACADALTALRDYRAHRRLR